MESSPFESKPHYGSVLPSNIRSSTSSIHPQFVEEKEEMASGEELEMEKLVFNCDERIFADEHHRLFRHLQSFSLRSFDDERMRSFYHRIFWVTVVVVVTLVFLRCAYVYTSIRTIATPTED